MVEWDIVHAATEPLPPADAPADIYFDAEATWVARRIGEPSVLDEDLALAYLAQAGIGPELTLGIARHVTIDPRGGDSEASDSRMTARVRGVHAFHPRSVGGNVAHDMGAAAPLDLPAGPPAGVHVELVNWDVIAQAVHPVRQQRPWLPSPFPYLPLTPQELLRAYLAIVGIAPQDSYGVQVTYGRPLNLLARTSTLPERPADHRRRRDAVRRRQGPRAHARRLVPRHHLSRPPRLRRGPGALGRLPVGGPEGRARRASSTRAARCRPATYGDGKLKRTFNKVVDVVDFFDPDSSNEPSFDPPALLLAARRLAVGNPPVE